MLESPDRSDAGVLVGRCKVAVFVDFAGDVDYAADSVSGAEDRIYGMDAHA